MKNRMLVLFGSLEMIDLYDVEIFYTNALYLHLRHPERNGSKLLPQVSRINVCIIFQFLTTDTVHENRFVQPPVTSSGEPLRYYSRRVSSGQGTSEGDYM